MHFTFNCNYLEYIQVGGDFLTRVALKIVILLEGMK